MKAEDNDKALALLPALLAELDALPHADRLQAVVEGVFAGNVACASALLALSSFPPCCSRGRTSVTQIFDLGASSTAAMHASGSLCYHDTRAKLQKRPWSVDDFDALAARIAAGPAHAKAVLFVDNSGADVVLGMLPLARELVRRGAAVILAANTVPSINDVTAAELSALLPRVAAVDPAVAGAVETGRLRVVASGSDLPVIDLRGLSDELVAEVADADLVVLEGSAWRGRGLVARARRRRVRQSLC